VKVDVFLPLVADGVLSAKLLPEKIVIPTTQKGWMQVKSNFMHDRRELVVTDVNDCGVDIIYILSMHSLVTVLWIQAD
jgi:hypothetical protein